MRAVRQSWTKKRTSSATGKMRRADEEMTAGMKRRYGFERFENVNVPNRRRMLVARARAARIFDFSLVLGGSFKAVWCHHITTRIVPMRRDKSMLLAASLLASATPMASAQIIINACGAFLNQPHGTAASLSHTCSSGTGTGSVTVDFPSGELHVKATGVAASPGTASGTYSDTVTIHGSLAQPLQFEIDLDIHGTLSGPASDPNFNGNGDVAAADLEAGNALAFGMSAAILQNYHGNNLPISAFPIETGTGSTFFGGLPADNIHIVLSDMVTVDAAHPSITITASLSAGAAPLTPGVETVDFGNTAVLSIKLPPGFSFTSASGALLTQPVPLPGALGLFGASLLGFFLSRKTRRR